MLYQSHFGEQLLHRHRRLFLVALFVDIIDRSRDRVIEFKTHGFLLRFEIRKSVRDDSSLAAMKGSLQQYNNIVRIDYLKNQVFVFLTSKSTKTNLIVATKRTGKKCKLDVDFGVVFVTREKFHAVFAHFDEQLQQD